jgi:hypothetical protein
MSRRLNDSSFDERPKPRKKIESTSVIKAKTTTPKIILHDPKRTDDSIQLDALPDKLLKIGKVSSYSLLPWSPFSVLDLT